MSEEHSWVIWKQFYFIKVPCKLNWLTSDSCTMHGRIHETTHKSQEVLSISKFKHENPLHQSQKSSPLLFCEQHRKNIVRFAIAIFYPFTSFLYNFVWCISHKNNAPYIRTATHIRKKCTNNLDSVIIIFRQFFLFYFISFYFEQSSSYFSVMNQISPKNILSDC